MKKNLIFLILIALLLSGCAGLPGSRQAGRVDCQTTLDPAASDPVAAVMPTQSDLPEGFTAVACDRLVEDEGFSAMTVARLYGLSQGWPGHLAVFNNPTQKVYVFVVSPIYSQDRQTFTDLLRTVNQYAAFRMVNAGVKLEAMPQAETFGKNNDYGEQSAAFGFEGRHNELNLAIPQAVMHDLVLVRRGAVIFGIESIYGTLKSPELSREKMLELAGKMDARLETVLNQNTQLKTVGVAPAPDWSTTAGAVAEKYAAMTALYPGLPEGFIRVEEPTPDLITNALGSWIGRTVYGAQHHHPASPDQWVQARVIYPLDAQEQAMFKQLLSAPERLAAYLLKPLMSSKVITPTEDLTRYYTKLPEAGMLQGVGDAASGFVLTLGELQDTALVLNGQALVVVTAPHPTGTTGQVSVGKYATWLAEEIAKIPAQ